MSQKKQAKILPRLTAEQFDILAKSMILTLGRIAELRSILTTVPVKESRHGEVMERLGHQLAYISPLLASEIETLTAEYTPHKKT